MVLLVVVVVVGLVVVVALCTVFSVDITVSFCVCIHAFVCSLTHIVCVFVVCLTLQGHAFVSSMVWYSMS